MMDNILQDLSFVFVYLDDILVTSSSFLQRLQHIHYLLSFLVANGILVNLKKCSSVDFLGHHMMATGITPLSSHVQAIADYPQPSSIKNLQQFLGLINFFRHFVPHAATILRPLTDALICSPKLLSWSRAMSNYFHQAKQALSHANLLA